MSSTVRGLSGWRSRQQQLGADASGVQQLLANGRQSDVVGCLDVVIADHGEVVGNAQAELMGRGDDTEGLGIAGREDRARPFGAGQDPACQLPGLVPAVCPMPNHSR